MMLKQYMLIIFKGGVVKEVSQVSHHYNVPLNYMVNVTI